MLNQAIRQSIKQSIQQSIKLVSRHAVLALALCFSLAGAAYAAVDVNTADEATLVTLKGIGPATASTIVAERTKGGPFKDAADLADRVKGLGQKSVARLEEAGMTIGAGTAPKSAAAVAKKEAKPADKAPAKAAR
ncbi:ComEA family DNA-binding protein [Cupriavidus sp. 30B13]|uniref:ComEA family DNA-binding protein n=1 Tax=Cupriavidus sp. 30B13 TaxID=3384241 RepID=UPI003B91393F